MRILTALTQKPLSMSNFFEGNNYFIDEKVGMFKMANEYRVYNENGDHIGAVKQKLSAGAIALRLFLNKQMLPFTLDIENANGGVEATISRGWTFWMSKINIKDGNGNPIGEVKQKFKFFKPTFLINDTAGSNVAQITGDWSAWDFNIADSSNNQIGTINKKWNGALKEIFTTADKYVVSINPNYTARESKMAVLATAITIEMVLKENK